MPSLENVALPNTLIEMEDDVFKNSKIVNLFIPKSVTILYQNNPFNYMPYLERIDVDPSNPKFASNNGILFSKNFDLLIHYPMHITSPLYIVPRTVRYINPYSFNQHQFIETIIFHGRILELRVGCFHKTTNLKSILIPNRFSLPKNLVNSFHDSNFTFPDNVTFYSDILETCKFIRNKFDLQYISLFISLLIL